MKYKFAIWGAGVRCKEIFSYVDSSYIATIVDANPEKQGALINGIEVVSPEIYYEHYKKYPLIVTPLNAEGKIIRELNDRGVTWTFPFWGKSRTNMGTFMNQMSEEWICRDLEINRRIVVYGWSILAILLCDFLEEHNYQYSVFLPQTTGTSISQFVESQYEMPVTEKLSDSDVIVLADEPEKAEVEILRNHITKSYYNITMDTQLFRNPAIEQFKGIHKGRRGFVVACGPSLRISDLDMLHKNGDICISMNRIFLAYQQTEWRPDYYMAVDFRAPEAYEGNRDDLYKRAAFWGDLLRGDAKKKYKNSFRFHLYNEELNGHAPDFSLDFASGSYWGMTVNYCAVELAVYMGFDEIYLIGADCCNYGGVTEKQHFIKNYSKHPSNIRGDDIIASFQVAKEKLQKDGRVNIYNATRGGKLEVFERVDFDSLF